MSNKESHGIQPLHLEFAHMVGKVQVLSKLTLGDFREMVYFNFEKINNDGTKMAESTMGYALTNENDGRAWFVSMSEFKQNYAFVIK